MAHLWESGFSVRQPAWHGLATIVDDHPADWAQARQWAGLDWDVIERPMPVIEWNERGEPGIATRPNGEALIDADVKALVRSDTGARLAHVGSGYEVISIADFGRIVEHVLDQPSVKYETAGSLDGGRIVWALAFIDEPVHIGGDTSPTIPYLLLLSHNDGRGAMQIIPTSVRVICANTVKFAEIEGDATGGTFSLHHTRNWRDRLTQARDAITRARGGFDTWHALAQDLYQLPVTDSQTEWFIDQFLPYPPEGTFTDRVRRNIDTARDNFRLLAHTPTQDTITGTAYGLFQQGTEYLDHIRPARSATTHFGRTMIRPDKQKHRLHTLARQAATVRP